MQSGTYSADDGSGYDCHLVAARKVLFDQSGGWKSLSSKTCKSPPVIVFEGGEEAARCESMAYSDFTLRGVKQAFSLKTEEQNDLFTKVVDAGVNENLNPWLQGQFPWGWQLALRKRVRK